MAQNRHKLPTSKEDLKNYIAKQCQDLKCRLSDDQIDTLAVEFEKPTETSVLDTVNKKPSKPSRKR